MPHEDQLSFLSESDHPSPEDHFGGVPITSHLISRRLEADLYAPIGAVLRDWWVPREELREAIVEITANQGRKQTGGLWTRPDLVVIGISAYPFIPGRSLELNTFEVKKTLEEGIEGVYEAAAQSAFSHRSFLLLQESGLISKELFTRIRNECVRFGIGLLTFSDPADWNTYVTLETASYRSPQIAQINKFIATQISETSRQRLLTMFR